MNKISNSGVYYDEFGQMVLVTQGLSGYTLVANKKILFRLFLDVAAVNPTAVLATITYRLLGFSIKKNIMIPSGSLLIENTAPNGPSIGILFTGDVFPFGGTYEIAFSVSNNLSSVLKFRITDLNFKTPGRLRLLIHNLVGTAPWGTKIESNFNWLVEMFQSLERFSAMAPVRDGIKFGLNHKDAGLCWLIGENIDPWSCPSGPCTTAENIAKLLRETNQINSGGTSEHVDATIGWRPRDRSMFPPPGGESTGGQAFPDKLLATFVGGNENGVEKTAAVMAQEVGHLFDLEPKESPHFDGGGHSKDRAVIDPFAFDFYRLKPYQPPVGGFIGDVMGVGWHQGSDLVLFNAFDWEHLRKKLTQLSGASTVLPAERQLTETEKRELINDFHKNYAHSHEIIIRNPERALSSQEGFVWHWTPLGFQRLQKEKEMRTRSGMAPGVESIQNWLEELDVSEVYAPLADRPLHMVINPNQNTSLPEAKTDIIGIMQSR